MLKIIYSSILFLFFFSWTSAQVIGINTQKIKEDRYAEIKGSPYLYKDWQMATLINKEEKAVEKIEVNYNGYTNGFEAKVEGGFIELEPRNYPKIKLLLDSSSFQYAFHTQLKNQYTQILFAGEKRSLIKSFVVTTSKREVQSPGKTITLESFVPKTTYYLLEEEELRLIKIKKKDILKKFPEKEVATFVKEHKLSLNSVEDLKQLLLFIEKMP